MSEWKEYRLGDILTLRSGFSYKGKFIGRGDSLLLGMGCVSYLEKFIMSGARPYSGSFDERYKVYPGDIVLATRQQSDNLPILAMPAMVPKTLKGKDLVIGTNLYKVEITDKSFSNEYIYWMMKTKRYVNYIKGVKTGTTVSMVTKKNVEDFTFFAPTDPRERERLVSIISSLDSKIENNRKISANLEAQAQALFKHWFIDFAPFKDGKFVESELGMIPEGWRVGTLEDLGKIICGKTPSKANKSYYGSDIPFIKIPDMHENVFILKSEDNLSIEGSNSQLNKMIPAFSIMVSCIATVGLVAMNVKPSHTNQQINTIVPFQSCYRYYVYENLKLRYKELLMLGSSGTTTYNVNTRTFSSLKVLVPELRVIEDFNNVIKSHFEKILNLYQESSRLSTLRDTLLPKLMSGAIKV